MQMNEGGAGAMEFLAMELKLSGKYLSRSLSFKGATFVVAEETLEDGFAADYDAAVAVWADLARAVQKNIAGGTFSDSQISEKTIVFSLLPSLLPFLPPSRFVLFCCFSVSPWYYAGLWDVKF